jgi:hypothetical protein
MSEEVNVTAAEIDAALAALAADDVTAVADAGWPELRLNVDLPAVELARRIGDCVGPRNVIWTRDDVPVVRVQGRFVPLEPVLMTTWLWGQHIVPWCRLGATDLPERVGARVLRSEEFRRRLPVLRGVNQVRLPVLRAEADDGGMRARRGFRRIELLPIGFDPESGIWTEGGVDYPDDWTQDDAQEWFFRIMRHFPWQDPDRMAVQMAAMFSLYCRELYTGRPPAFVWNSNLSGSGKSTLARLPLRMILGRATPMFLNQSNTRELDEQLNTAAVSYVSAVWWDDVRGRIYHELLRTWVTEDTRGGRLLGGNTMFDVSVRAVTFFTGAQLTIDDHMARRSLWVDLFPTQRIEDRVLPEDTVRLTARWLADGQNRREFLAAMWAAVRHWDGQNRPEGSGLIDSLEGWSEVVPGIVAANGWGDCLAARSNQTDGDLDTVEGRALIQAVIREFREVGTCGAVDVIATARRESLFKHVLGDLDLLIESLDMRRGWVWRTAEENRIPTRQEKAEQAARYRDERVDSRWGKIWKRLAMENLEHVVDGRRYLFAKRGDRGVYDIRELA